MYQWALTTPVDWLDTTASEWSALRDLGVPGLGVLAGTNLGWINAVNVQGVVFEGYDHYAIEPITNGVRVYVWNDDPDDFTSDQYHGSVWEFLSLAVDIQVGGLFNTRQTFTSYVPLTNPRAVPSENETLTPWSDFVPPSASITRHGIWTTNSIYDASKIARTAHGWREWTAGVPAGQIVNGEVRG